MWSGEPFNGAKLALIYESAIIGYRRDENLDISFPGMWDLPGGGREGGETPEACVLRELHEEFGIRLAASRLIWARRYPPRAPALYESYFFGAKILIEEINIINFGNEGIYWELRPIESFLSCSNAVPHLKIRLRDCVEGLSGRAAQTKD